MKKSQTHAQGRGRPSKYNDEYPDKLLEYFNEYLQNPSTSQVVEKTTKFYQNGQVKEELEKFKFVSRGVPTLFGFALENKISYRTLNRWSNAREGKAPNKDEVDKRPFKYPDFRHAYKMVEHFQTEFLLKAGMSGNAPAAFAIFSAKNMIGWRDTTDQRFVDKDGKDVAAAGYVLLPERKTEEEAQKEFEEQEKEG